MTGLCTTSETLHTLSWWNTCKIGRTQSVNRMKVAGVTLFSFLKPETHLLLLVNLIHANWVLFLKWAQGFFLIIAALILTVRPIIHSKNKYIILNSSYNVMLSLYLLCCPAGGCGWGGRVVVLQWSAVRSPVFPKNMHAEVSLSKMLNPELCLIEQQSAANRCTVWMCVWLGECKNCTVKRFEWSSRLEKRYIQIHLPSITIHLMIVKVE